MLNWTREKPTIPGWYWYQGSIQDRLLKDHVHTILEIVYIHDPHARDGARGVIARSGTEVFYEWDDFLNGKWAGPIEPPP